MRHCRTRWTRCRRGEAVALAYGLCNGGLVGVEARKLPVIVPRAHDCLAILLGSNKKYVAEVERPGGTYFQNPGWIENLPVDRVMREQIVPIAPGLQMTREQLIERFGAEDAEYLLEQLGGAVRRYRRLGYIASLPQMGQFAERAREMAREQGWVFETLPGDLGWLRRLVFGPWEEGNFLRVEPGQRVAARFDGGLIGAEPV